MKRHFGNWRFYAVFLLAAIATGVIIIRLFCLQVLQHGSYTALAKDQHELLQQLIPRRGEIFIQEKGDTWHPLAVNRSYQTAFLVPREVADKEELAQNISPLVGIAADKILEKLADPNDPYEPLKSKLDDETAQKIRELDLKGVYLINEGWRWYPQGNLASNVLGFVGMSEEQKIGQYGLEQYYENELAGQSGFLKSEKDALGRWLLMQDYNLEPAKDGANLYLTLDQNIQYVVEQKLKEVAEKWAIADGCAIVMDPQSGAIRAMASWPDFNPNEYQKVEHINDFMNSCTQKTYEPGSVFKPIVMAAGLDTGKISPETIYTDTGSVQISGYTIKNALEKVYGVSTMTKVLENSINTGAIFAERATGNDNFKKYSEAFGFDSKTGVDLAGEAVGNLNNLKTNREINFATASFGQGISVTSLEMASAISAIANDGKLMKPYLVEKSVDPDGQEKLTQPQLIRNIISPKTAGQLTAMLVSTVRNGYDKIKLTGYFVAGKTGTAQISLEGKVGYSDDTNHSFAGYAPAYNPKFLIFLMIGKPKGVQFASGTLAPLFAEIARYLLDYYESPPEE
jgi:cell division protein FtsI/penicillin-binding protein 2